MYVRNSSKKRKYLIVKLFGTNSSDRSLYVCRCRYNGCINKWDVHIKYIQSTHRHCPWLFTWPDFQKQEERWSLLTSMRVGPSSQSVACRLRHDMGSTLEDFRY